MKQHGRGRARDLDRIVEQAYYRTCPGMAISVMEIPALFRVGREAILRGADKAELERVVKAFAETIAL
jgi:hypothetical protein